MTPTLAECLDRKRNDLAAVRILAAIAVLHAHAWIVTTPGIKTADFFHVFGFSLDFHGVHAFFILSGMLLTRSLMERAEPLRFIVARIMRYVPAILVAALFAAFVVGPAVTRLSLGDYLFSTEPLAFVAAITSLYDVTAVLPGVFEQSPQPGIMFIPLWTIHYELVFAMVLPFLWISGLLAIRWLVMLGLVATLAVCAVWFWNGEEFSYLGWPHHLLRFCAAFGLGIALAVFADRIPVSNRIFLVLALIAAPLAYSHFAAVAGLILLSYAIITIGFVGGRLASALARLGIWSYGFYVWGYLIEQTVAYAAPGWNAWQVFAASFVLALAAGALSWRYVERPTIGMTGAIAASLRRIIFAGEPKAAASAGRE